MQADAAFRAKPEDIGNIHVRSNSSGQMIPLKALIRVDNLIGPEQVERYNSYVSAKVLGSAKAGFSSGEAIAVVEKVAQEMLPPGYSSPGRRRPSRRSAPATRRCSPSASR